MKVKYMNIKHNLNKMMKMKLKQNQTKQYCSAMNIIRIENDEIRSLFVFVQKHSKKNN